MPEVVPELRRISPETSRSLRAAAFVFRSCCGAKLQSYYVVSKPLTKGNRKLMTRTRANTEAARTRAHAGRTKQKATPWDGLFALAFSSARYLTNNGFGKLPVKKSSVYTPIDSW